MMLELLLLAGSTPVPASPGDVVTAMFDAFNQHDVVQMARL